jgi:hypothetical protein
MSMIDLLLAADASRLTELPTEELEVSRLSALIGEKFTITIGALTMRQFDTLPRGDDFKVHVVLEAIKEPNFRDPKLAEKLMPAGRKTPLTPVEVVNHLFLPGEIINIYNAITELSGFGEDAVERVEKN